MSTYKKVLAYSIEDCIEELYKYTMIDNTEFGEFCSSLINLYRRKHMTSEELGSKLENEIRECLIHYMDNYSIRTYTNVYNILEPK